MVARAAPRRATPAALPADPCAERGIAGFARGLRSGAITAEAATQAYLGRIERLEPALNAFEHVAFESALATARAVDRLLATGTDSGPLMGVPVAIKDILAVEGAPTTAGSNLDVADLIGPEGSFVRLLRRLGCVILGKTKTPEFAHGAGRFAVSLARGTPRNPWDARVRRVPGGSSSGSGAAVAAGLCAFAVGSDTGASIRLPAAFMGIHGLKTTAGLWPTDGVFSLSSTLDTIGLLAPSAADQAFVFAAIAGTPVSPLPPRGLRLGKLGPRFFDDLEPEVGRSVEAALAALTAAGASIEPVEFPETAESIGFPGFIYAEFIAGFGRERFARSRARMDPFVGGSLAEGLDVRADDYVRMRRRYDALCRMADAALAGFDAFVTPTCSITAPANADLDDPVKAERLRPLGVRNTRFATFAGLCATSSPIQRFGRARLPVGLQVICRGGAEATALGIGLAIENLAGRPPRPDLAGFLA